MKQELGLLGFSIVPQSAGDLPHAPASFETSSSSLASIPLIYWDKNKGGIYEPRPLLKHLFKFLFHLQLNTATIFLSLVKASQLTQEDSRFLTNPTQHYSNPTELLNQFK